jgi:hypothetical protein
LGLRFGDRAGARKRARGSGKNRPAARSAHAGADRAPAKRARKFAREYLRGGEPERRRRRVERNVERLEDWVGRLSEGQVQRVALYSERAPLLEEWRERDRKRLQAELLSLVRERQARKLLPDAAAHWDRGREPGYAAAYEASRSEYFSMVLDIDRSLSPEQRARALRRIRGWADDFRKLSRPR